MLDPNRFSPVSKPRVSSRLRLLFMVGSIAAASLVGSTLLLSGCATDLEDPTRFDAYINAEPKGNGGGLPCDLDALMTKSCWGIGCHGSNTPAAMLDLETAGVEGRIVDVPASHGDILDGTAPNCMAGELRVDTANPENSVILKKVLGTHSCGGKMPVSPRTVTPADVECLRAWVYQLSGKEPGMGTAGTGGMSAGGSGGTGGSAGGTAGAAGATAGTGGTAGGTGGSGGTGGA